MNLTFMYYNFYPILLNFLMLMILSLPSKFNKFNPINLTLLLIMLTILISLKLNMMINSWSSYIIFLIMIGGLMIIFMYIMSLANNELFSFNFKYMILNSIKFLPLMIFFLMMMKLYFYWNNNFIWYNYLNLNFNLNFYEIYHSNYSKMIFFIMNYLFYSMICIMNICYKMKLPLRQLFL
uniref:NADH dehydrogenase subunit 6 n=1 Tax=Pimpla luctuosa TaxID=495389 RepID=A0A3S8V151_9HYME|nr:NADH dehydrogenase subunit 6 [Pimpla luctuosa]